MTTTFDVTAIGNGAVRLLGGAAGDFAGTSVAGGSDVNGDGIADIIIGARGVGDNAGAAYVVFGTANGFTDDLDLSALGSAGLTVSAPANTGVGFTVALPGDVNNDGVDDILIGAGSFLGGVGVDNAYLIFGDASLPTSLNANSLGANGLVLSNLGTTLAAVSGAGDIDNDGIPDILLGSQGRNETYLVYGTGSLGADIDVTAGPSFNGEQGYSVAGGGDINGDGIDDIVIGDNYGSPAIFGSATRFGNGTSLDPIGTAGLRLTTSDVTDYLGRSVAVIGDINNDGFDDVAVVARRIETPNGYENGGTFVLFGGASVNGEVAVDSVGSAGFLVYDTFDATVAPAGDFNGDGIDDFMIGTAGYGARIIFGRDGGFSDDLNLNDLADDEGIKLFAGAAGGLGTSLAPIGDINDDGFDDILLGKTDDSTNGSSAGAAYIVFGFSTAAQNLAGGGDDDTLTGGVGDDTLSGGGGHDLLVAGGGNDMLDGGDGDDRGYGQAGNDSLAGGAGNDSLFGNLGDDSLAGGDDDDMVRAHVGNDTVMGDGGSDNLFGGGSDDMVDGGDGDDTVGGNSGIDVVMGSGGNDVVRGQGGADQLFGGDGNDLVLGMQGFDALFGGAGNDTLVGGEADDTLTGGTGADAFAFAATQGADTITDFADGTDVISLIGVANFGELTITDTADGARITFEVTPTTAIVVTGINASQLTAADFFFS